MSEKGGRVLRGAAVMAETAITAEAANTFKTIASFKTLSCILQDKQKESKVLSSTVKIVKPP